MGGQQDTYSLQIGFQNTANLKLHQNMISESAADIIRLWADQPW